MTHYVESNPWFSPPALQYVSRFGVNPPVQNNACYGMHWHQDRPFDPPVGLAESAHGSLPRYAGPRQALDYQDNPPLYWHPGGSHRYHGRLYRGSGYWGRYPDEAPEDFHPGSGVPWGGGYHPGGGYRSNPLEWHPGGAHTYHGEQHYGSGRMHHHGRSPSTYHPGGGVPHHGEWHAGGGHYEANPSGPYGGFSFGDRVTWSREAVEDFGRRSGEIMYVKSSTPAGDVIVSHPRNPRGIAVLDWELERLVDTNPYQRRGEPELPGVWHEDYADEYDDGIGSSIDQFGAFEFNPPYDPSFGGTRPLNPYGTPRCPHPQTRPLPSRGSEGWDGWEECTRCGDMIPPRHPGGARRENNPGCRPDGMGGQDCWYPNPGTRDIRGYQVPVEVSPTGRYHRIRVMDPRDCPQTRTKTISARKGLKQLQCVTGERGPRGGTTQVQSWLFDADMYTPDDVARWAGGHDLRGEPLLFTQSKRKATKRRLAVGPKKGTPKKRKAPPKKKAAAKKRKPAAKKKRTASKRKRKVAANAGGVPRGHKPGCGCFACVRRRAA